jgi:diguanylate cyclase (GGDEF)-like protein
VLLPGVDLGAAVEVAERVRHAVETARPGNLNLTLSAGVAAEAGGNIRYDELFRAADSALLEAKRTGRNRVETAGGLSRLALADGRQLAGDPSAVRT